MGTPPSLGRLTGPDGASQKSPEAARGLALTLSGILANSLRMGTSNTRRLSRCCSMDGRMYLRRQARGGGGLTPRPAGPRGPAPAPRPRPTCRAT